MTLSGLRLPTNVAGLVTVALLLESVVVKSVFFDRNDPIAFHYVFSGLAIAALLAHVLWHPKMLRLTTRLHGRLTFIVIVAWLALVTTTRLTAFEVSAVVGFALLVLCFYFTLPIICLRLGLPPRSLVLASLVACVLLSPLVLLDAGLAFESPSLRYRGCLISVAVACNVFFFACVYATWAWKFATGRRRWFYLAVAALSFVLLLMTFTKSSTLQAVLGMTILLVTNRRGRMLWRRVFVAAALVVATPLVALPYVDVDATLQALRIIDNNVLASRDNTWDEGLHRAMDAALMGNGLLTKQTKGGTEGVEISSDNYDSSYDAHSLGISLVEQGGLPFMAALLVLLALPLVAYLQHFGWSRSIQAPEFIIMIIIVPSMMFTGGDMVSLGSLINRLQWLFLGVLSLEVLTDRIRIRQAR